MPFPGRCVPCECNGHAEECEDKTGRCLVRKTLTFCSLPARFNGLSRILRGTSVTNLTCVFSVLFDLWPRGSTAVHYLCRRTKSNSCFLIFLNIFFSLNGLNQISQHLWGVCYARFSRTGLCVQNRQGSTPEHRKADLVGVNALSRWLVGTFFMSDQMFVFPQLWYINQTVLVSFCSKEHAFSLVCVIKTLYHLFFFPELQVQYGGRSLRALQRGLLWRRNSWDMQSLPLSV